MRNIKIICTALLASALALSISGCGHAPVLYDKNNVFPDSSVRTTSISGKFSGLSEEKENFRTYTVYADPACRNRVCTITTKSLPGILDNTLGNMSERVMYTDIVSSDAKENIDRIIADSGIIIIQYSSGDIETYTSGCVVFEN